MTLSREEESAHGGYTSFLQRNTYLQTAGSHPICVTLFLLKSWTIYWGVRSLSKKCKHNSTMNFQLSYFQLPCWQNISESNDAASLKQSEFKMYPVFRRKSNPSSKTRSAILQPEIIPIKTKKVPHFPPHKPLISPLSPSRHLAMVRSGNNANNTRGPQRSMATAKMMKDVVIVIVIVTDGQ